MEDADTEKKFEITIKKQHMLYGVGIMVLFAAAIGIGIFKSGALQPQEAVSESTVTANVSPNGNEQMIDLTVRGGYRPLNTVAEAGKETVLKLKTQNTFDCSASVVIPELNYSETLPVSGVTEVKIPAQEKGSVITGSCSMGMYGFRIKFI